MPCPPGDTTKVRLYSLTLEVQVVDFGPWMLLTLATIPCYSPVTKMEMHSASCWYYYYTFTVRKRAWGALP